MPNMNSDEKVSRPRKQNIYDHLVSRWDQKALRNAMDQAIESLPQFIIVSFRFVDEVKNYRCKVFKSGTRFFIGGCRESNNIVRFPLLEQIAW